MNEKYSDRSDQADGLRKIIEEQKAEEEKANSVSPQLVRTGTLPPRSTIHKRPPLNVTPYYVAGVICLLLVGGLVFWWYTARSTQPTVAQPQVQANAKDTAATKPPAASTVAKPAPPVKSNPPSPAPKQKVAPKPVTGNTQQAAKVPASTSSAAVTQTSKTVAKPVKKKPVIRKKRALRHRVQPGDTLYKISVMYYGTGKYQFYLARYNGIRDTGNVLVGSVVKVPLPPR
jgi:nucleoid-associated protein YgaU